MYLINVYLHVHLYFIVIVHVLLLLLLQISCRMISLEVISEMLLTSSAPSICGRGIGCGQLLRVIVNKCSDKSSK